MGFDFLTDLSNMQVEIPPEVSRLAGFFVLLQGGMIYLQKKNNPAKDIWEDLSWVFLGGLFVYLFPELIRFMETLVNALMPIELHADSAIAEFMKESNLGDGSVPPPDSSTSFGNILMNAFLKSGTGQNAAGYLIAQGVLKPFADLVNYLCFPTFLTIRAVGLKVIYWSAPLFWCWGPCRLSGRFGSSGL